MLKKIIIDKLFVDCINLLPVIPNIFYSEDSLALFQYFEDPLEVIKVSTDSLGGWIVSQLLLNHACLKIILKI